MAEIIQAPELIKILKEAGIEVSASNLSRAAELYGLKEAPKLARTYYDKRFPNAKGRTVNITKGIYYKPTAAELKNIKKQYDINKLKNSTLGEGKTQFLKRQKAATQLLKSGNYTMGQANEKLKTMFPGITSMKATLTQLAKNIKGIPSGKEGPTATVVKKVTNALNKLDKSEIRTLIKSNNYTPNQLINKTSKILKIDDNLAARRLGQLVEAYRGDTKYINATNELLARHTHKITKSLTQGLWGGIGGALVRTLNETKVAQALDEKRSFFPSVKKRIGEVIGAGTGYETDVVKNLASSARHGTSPYSIFIQSIRGDLNKIKGRRLDHMLGTAEKKMQAATTMVEKKKIAEAYNKEAKDFVNKANKNLKKGQLPVRTMEISFDAPSKTIKNKKAYELWGDVYDDIHATHGYSFKVPKDLRTVYDVVPFIKSGKGQIQIAKAIAQNAPRLISAAPYVAIPAVAGALAYGMLKPTTAAAEEKELPKPEEVPSVKYNKEVGAFLDPQTDDKVSQAGLLTWAVENPIPVVAGTAVTGLATKKGRSIGKGALKKLAALGAPLPTAAIDAYFINKQIEEGRDPSEIAKDPFNWLGLATMSPLTKAAGLADKSGKLASVMRLGMSPGMIRGASRFLGLPGLALSTGLTAYDQYQKYKNKEGFIYDLFNPEEIDNAKISG